MKYLYGLILIALLAPACDEDPCLKSTGAMVIDRREITSDSIALLELIDDLDVEIYYSDKNYLEVVGGEHLVSYVKSYDKNHVLELVNENSCQFLRNFDQELKVKLYLNSLIQIKYNGTGNVEFKDQWKVRDFRFIAESGSGSIKLWLDTYSTGINIDDGNVDVTCTGVSRHFSVYTAGSSQVLAPNFDCVYGGVWHDSSADCVVAITDSIECTLESLGNVILTKDPFVTIHRQDGKGRVVKF
ncbi:MAG: DUF2807 domain-containing protein [Vicingaceae bacterium]